MGILKECNLGSSKDLAYSYKETNSEHTFLHSPSGHHSDFSHVFYPQQSSEKLSQAERISMPGRDSSPKAKYEGLHPTSIIHEFAELFRVHFSL